MPPRKPKAELRAALPGVEEPLAPGEVRAHRFDDVARDRFLTLVRAGARLGVAASQVGFNMDTVRRARKADPLFDALVLEAEEDAAEPVEQALYDAAVKGEPWAVKLWLANRSQRYKRGEDGRGEQGPQVVVDLSGMVVAGKGGEMIPELERRLEARLRGVIDVPAIEGPQPDVVPPAGAPT